ncbi:hypothetical protein V3C99_008155, partial [Haemonchus contortus]
MSMLSALLNALRKGQCSKLLYKLKCKMECGVPRSVNGRRSEMPLLMPRNRRSSVPDILCDIALTVVTAFDWMPRSTKQRKEASRRIVRLLHKGSERKESCAPRSPSKDDSLWLTKGTNEDVIGTHSRESMMNRTAGDIGDA